MAKLSILKLLAYLMFWFASTVFAFESTAPLPPDQAFQFSAKLTNANRLTLSWDIASGHYLYRDKIRIVSLTPGITAGKPAFPASHTKHDEFFGDMEVFRGRLAVDVPLHRQDSKVNTLLLEADYQGCSDAGVCYLPIHKSLSFSLPIENVNGDNAAPTSGQYPSFVSEQNRIAATLQKGTVWLIALSFLGFGILLAFTPCIFPMLPILSGIVVGQGTNLNMRRAFWLSLSYVLASTLTYTVFGILAGLFGSNLQALFQEPWVIIAFSGIFILLALSMFGGFQFQIPSFIQTRIMALSSKQQGGNLWGAAVMGMLSTLAIGPCVTAPLAGVLIYIGQTGDAVLGGLALFALGLGMGIPLIIVGTYAGKWLPKAGAWLNIAKVIFGIGLLAVAVWLLSRIISVMAALALWSLLVIFPVILLLSKKRWRGAGLLTAAYGILLWVGISTNQPDALRPALCRAAIACKEQLSLTLKFKKIGTVQELQQNLTEAHANNQWVMLDFYADWCATCVEMALYTFSDPKVQAALSQVTLVQADVTQNSPADRALLRQFELIGPPAILFFGPDQKERNAYRVVGYMKPDNFLDIISRVFRKPLS